MKKQFLRTLLLLFISSLFLGTSVNIAGAFLDSDLGLNLYKDLDEGLKDFEEKMFIFEIRGQDNMNIGENINKFLYIKGLGKCLKETIDSKSVKEIINGELAVLIKNIKPECYNSKTGEYDTKKMGAIINEIKNIKEYYLKKSKEKAKNIHEISRIGMYSDGNTDNSPFDIISDLNEISNIIFSTPINYSSEDVDFLKNYQNKPLSCSPGKDNSQSNIPSSVVNNELLNNEIYSNDNYLSNINDGKVYTNQDILLEEGINLSVNCTNTNESGLNEESLEKIIGILDNSKNTSDINENYLTTNNYNSLYNTNKIQLPNLTSPTFISQCSGLGIKLYEKVTDKNIWECNEYFCIITDFIVRNQRVFDYSVDNSIENIIKKSNKHLKKAMNTSLVQSKMTTNNFEMAFRDLNLVDMFHMGIQVSYKSPPILNLETLPGDTIKDMLIEKYKNLGLNYDDPNNLNNFNGSLRKMKSIILTTENPSNRSIKINSELKEVLKLRSKIIDYNKEVVSKEINNKIIKDFEIQFKEITQFNINIFDYVNGLDILIKKLKEIPIYTG